MPVRLVGNYKRSMEDTDFRAQNAFARAIFPAGHPNRPPDDDQTLVVVSFDDEALDAVSAAHIVATGVADTVH